MFPWDFGIINAIKQGIGLDIYPSPPPDNQYQTPYLVFEIKSIRTEQRLLSRVEFSMTFVEKDSHSGEYFEILKALNKIISRELTLSQEEFQIGTARIKITSIECKKNNIILNCTAMLRLMPSYEDSSVD
jgi:hypothetical protein